MQMPARSAPKAGGRADGDRDRLFEAAASSRSSTSRRTPSPRPRLVFRPSRSARRAVFCGHESLDRVALQILDLGLGEALGQEHGQKFAIAGQPRAVQPHIGLDGFGGGLGGIDIFGAVHQDGLGD